MRLAVGCAVGRIARIGCCLFLLLAPRLALAHESLPLYLGLSELSQGRFDVVWRIPATQGAPPAVSPAFPEQCAVTTPPTLLPSLGTLVGHEVLDCRPPGLGAGKITLVGLDHTVLDAFVRIAFADGAELTAIVHPRTPVLDLSGRVRGTDMGGYFRLGVEHILFGPDHLLFVLGLLLIVRNGATLLKTVTAFTVAHSMTLAAATLGRVALPVLPLNAAIALSILFLGPEIVRARSGGTSLTIRHPWVVAFAFGLLHGFGFASGLATIGLPRSEIPLALLLFNLGVEAGQIAFVLLILGLVRAFRLMEIRWPRPVGWAPTYVVGALGAFWTIQRLAMLIGVGS